MITVNRQALLAALEPCARVANPRSTLPIVANVLLDAKGDRLAYRATNLQHEISGHVAAKGTGSFCVSAKDLAGAVSSLEGDDVTLDLKKDQLTVKATGKRSFKLPTLPAEEFPAPMNVGGDEVELPAGLLPRLISATLFQARTESDRPEQHVVRIDSVGGKLRAATTDGKGAAMLVVESSASLALSIPSEVCRMLLDHKDEPILVVNGGRAMAFQVGDRRLSCTPPEGAFPPMDAVVENLPKPAGTLTVDAGKLLGAVKAVRRAGADLILNFGGSTIRLTCNENGEATDEVEADGDAPEYESWVPADQFAAALAAVDGDVVVSLGGDELAPLQLTQGDWRAFIMPMRPDYVKSKRKAA